MSSSSAATVIAAPLPVSADDASSADAFRFDVFAQYGYRLSAAVHAGMVLLFFFLEQYVLSSYNILSVAIFVAASVLHKRGWVRLAYAIAIAEISAFATLATVWIGWESGAYMYVIFTAVSVFFVPFLSPSIKTRAVALQCALVIALVPLTRLTGIIKPLGESTALVILVTNMVVLMIVLAMCMHALSRAVHQAEERLTRFSASVSEYLDPMLVRSLSTNVDLHPRTKYITVFFVDLVGSTRISAAMEAEQFGAMIQQFVREMQRVIKAHRGYLEDISGDGIFGYVGNFDSRGPVQDAVSVVTLACDMQSRLKELNDTFRHRYDLPEPLATRICISSGEALVGETDAVRAVYTANSESVNLGSKLEQAMKRVANGGVLMSAETTALVSGRFEVSEHTVSIDGHEVKAYSVNTASDCE